jgi:hypothetical protein
LGRPLLRRVALALLLPGLGACGLMPPSQQQSFNLSSDPAMRPAVAKPFQNTDPNINAVLAKQICVDDFQKLNQKTLPADSGTIDQWTVRCAPYHPTLIAGIPLPPVW